MGTSHLVHGSWPLRLIHDEKHASFLRRARLKFGICGGGGVIGENWLNYRVTIGRQSFALTF